MSILIYWLLPMELGPVLRIFPLFCHSGRSMHRRKWGAGGTGVKCPVQACIASARQSRDWNPGVSCIEATVLTPTICPYLAAVAASCGLSNTWFLLWSYFCFHFLSAITFGNHERELTCYFQTKIWGLCRVERLFPVWAAGIWQRGKLSHDDASDELPPPRLTHTWGSRLQSPSALCRSTSQ